MSQKQQDECIYCGNPSPGGLICSDSCQRAHFGMGPELKPCRFTFADDTEYDGFTDGSTWNGFDNVWVTEDTHKAIADYFLKVCDYDPEELELPNGPDASGLVSYAGGFATCIIEPEQRA